MAYKARFRPSEILAGGAWRMLTDADFGAAGAEDWCRRPRGEAGALPRTPPGGFAPGPPPGAKPLDPLK